MASEEKTLLSCVNKILRIIYCSSSRTFATQESLLNSQQPLLSYKAMVQVCHSRCTIGSPWVSAAASYVGFSYFPCLASVCSQHHSQRNPLKLTQITPHLCQNLPYFLTWLGVKPECIQQLTNPCMMGPLLLPHSHLSHQPSGSLQLIQLQNTRDSEEPRWQRE